ncbi:cell division protein FtsN [Testudinibacter sp. P80/BLE/0925]|uniref:cell division protein FtsN n=1 Tax=Testudinibacter sp. TW-1 TaxID=3417757 RepID=UPI003D3613F8
MVQRDYATRGRATSKKKANKVNKGLLLGIAFAMVAIFAAGLYLLKEKSTESGAVVATVDKVEENKPKSTLPSRPEEVWSYIRDLETREIPIDNSPKSLDKVQNLTEEQKKILQMLERDAEAAEAAKNDKNVAVQAQVQQTLKHNEPNATIAPPVVVEKPKAQTNTKPVESKPAEVVQAKPKQESSAAQQTKKTASTAKFGLQCGAFKNREQAENLQARLVMAGFDARVSSSSTFNRIFIGPIGDRAAANATLQKAKGVTECVVIGM